MNNKNFIISATDSTSIMYLKSDTIVWDEPHNSNTSVEFQIEGQDGIKEAGLNGWNEGKFKNWNVYSSDENYALFCYDGLLVEMYCGGLFVDKFWLEDINGLFEDGSLFSPTRSLKSDCGNHVLLYKGDDDLELSILGNLYFFDFNYFIHSLNQVESFSMMSRCGKSSLFRSLKSFDGVEVGTDMDNIEASFGAHELTKFLRGIDNNVGQ